MTYEIRFALAVLPLLFICGICGFHARAQADDGVNDSEITIGVVNDTSGKIAFSGNSMNAGLKAAFERVKGGVHGRKINMVALDDVYDPEKTVALTKELIHKHHVFALMGYNANSPIKAVTPLLSKGDVPFLFPRSSDDSLREQHSRVVYNLRAGSAVEMEALIKAMLERKITRFAILYQPDALGDAIKTGAISAMRKLGIFDPAKSRSPFVGEASAPRAASDAAAVFEKLDQGNPEALLIAANPVTAAQVIKIAAQKKRRWVSLATSMASSLPAELKDIDDPGELIMSQVLPSPDASDLAVAVEFRDDMKKSGAEKLVNYISFEGYLEGRILVEALQRAGQDLTRSKLMMALDGDPFKIGGFVVDWSPTDHQGFKSVYLLHLKNKKLVDYRN